MARRRRRRGSSTAPLILLALVLAAIVIWAIVPRRPRVVPKPPPPIAAVSAAVSPTAAPPASPSSSPVASAPASPTPSPLPANAPQLAIIVDDCGQWLDTERGFLALPIPITMSVMPHVRYTATIAQEAEQDGKGVMLHLPMEPITHGISGPGQIDVTMTDAQITEQTENDAAQVPLARGVNNHEGSAATADARVMRDVMAVVKAHGLFFIDSRTTARTVAAAQAQEDGVPEASRDVFLDNQASVAYTEQMLRHAVEIAKRKGSAIAIGHPKPTTLAALTALYPWIQAQGVRFVLASNLVH